MTNDKQKIRCAHHPPAAVNVLQNPATYRPTCDIFPISMTGQPLTAERRVTFRGTYFWSKRRIKPNLCGGTAAGRAMAVMGCMCTIGGIPRIREAHVGDGQRHMRNATRQWSAIYR